MWLRRVGNVILTVNGYAQRRLSAFYYWGSTLINKMDVILDKLRVDVERGDFFAVDVNTAG